MQADGLPQALEGIKAVASLGGAAIVLWVIYVIGDMLLPEALDGAPGGYGDVLTNQWLTTGLDVILPAAFLGLVFFGLIARAIFAREY